MVTKDKKDQFGLKRIPFVDGTQQAMSKRFQNLADLFLAANVKKSEYVPTWTAEKDEISYIDNFVLPKEQQDAENIPEKQEKLKPPFQAPDAAAKSIMMVDISVPGKTRFYFQSFNQTKIVRPETTFYFTMKGYKEADDAGITIADKLDAVIADGKLYFKSFTMARQFLKLDAYFAEASDDEIKKFAKHSKLFVSDVDDVIALVNPIMRKKFHNIISSKVLDHPKVSPTDIQALCSKIMLDIEISKVSGAKQIVLPTEKNKLERFLGFMSDDIYESMVTGTIMQSNSHRRYVLPTTPVKKPKKKK
jgi:hypothetical protein